MGRNSGGESFADGIFHRTDGTGSLSWLILSNPIGTDLSVWDALLPDLTTRFRVLRHDTRGHGRSVAAADGAMLEDYARDILRLMDARGIARAHFAGLSMGAMTSLLAASFAPDRTLGVTFCNAILKADRSYAAFWRERASIVVREGLEAIVEPTLDRWLSPQASPEVRRRTGEMLCRTSVRGFETAALALSRLDVSSIATRLPCPIHFVAGEFDQAAPSETIRDAACAAVNGRFSIAPNAHHLSIIEHPAIISNFLGRYVAR